MTSNPNSVTIQARGARSTSRRTGNRIDRVAEKMWITSQAACIPYGVAPAILSLAKTYYNRALFLSFVYLMAPGGIGYLSPGACYTALGLYALWELWITAYLWRVADLRRDLFVRGGVAIAAVFLVSEQIFYGVCHV